MAHDMNDDMEFEENIKAWSPAEQYLARGMKGINERCLPCVKNVEELENRVVILESGAPSGKKQALTNAASGGITGAVTAAIIAIIEYLRTAH